MLYKRPLTKLWNILFYGTQNNSIDETTLYNSFCNTGSGWAVLESVSFVPNLSRRDSSFPLCRKHLKAIKIFFVLPLMMQGVTWHTSCLECESGCSATSTSTLCKICHPRCHIGIGKRVVPMLRESRLPLAAGRGEFTQPRDHSFAQPCTYQIVVTSQYSQNLISTAYEITPRNIPVMSIQMRCNFGWWESPSVPSNLR